MFDLPDEEVVSSCITLLESFQRAVNRAVYKQGLNGDEFHMLNVINNGLFGLLMIAKLGMPEAEEPTAKHAADAEREKR